MKPAFIVAAGLAAPGLDGWEAARVTLRGTHRYQPQNFKTEAPDVLPANERRRATSLTRIALQAAQDALARHVARPQAAELRTVFASSHGDAAVTDRICTALWTAQRPISPTDFHNSVHNAPAGYWAIGTGSRAASTSISLLDGTFSAGLLESLTIVAVESTPVLLVVYDEPLPSPLGEEEAVTAPFAAAFALTPDKDEDNAVETIATIRTKMIEDRLEDPGLEHLRLGNPAARSLPLLKSVSELAIGIERKIILPYLEDAQLELTIRK